MISPDDYLGSQQQAAGKLSDLPLSQGLTLLIGFPLVYMANGLMPWSYGLFVEGDRKWYVPFFCSLIVLHWLSVAFTVLFLRRAHVPLSEIGFRWKISGVATFFIILTVAGAALIALRATWGAGELPTEKWQLLYPFTISERCLWVVVAITAGFCEEFVYRGFGIRYLQARGLRTWKAVTLATLSFIFIHGFAAFIAFPFFAIAGLIFAAIFLWRNSLTPVIYIHALFDLSAVLAL